MNHLELNETQKVEILVAAWNDISKQIETVSGYQNRNTLSFLTFCSAVLLYTKTVYEGDINKEVVISLSVMILVFTIAANMFLASNYRRLKWLCRSLSQIQTALGMYEDSFFMKNDESVRYKSLFDPKGQKWGVGGNFLSYKTRIVFIWIVFLCSVAFLIGSI